MKKRDVFSAKVSEEARGRIFREADRLLDELHAKSHGSLLSTPVSAATRDRILREGDRVLDGISAAPETFLSRLFGTWGGLSLAGLAGAAAVVIAISAIHRAPPANAPVALEPELLRNVDLLLDLDTLEKWTPENNGKGNG